MDFDSYAFVYVNLLAASFGRVVSYTRMDNQCPCSSPLMDVTFWSVCDKHCVEKGSEKAKNIAKSERKIQLVLCNGNC